MKSVQKWLKNAEAAKLLVITDRTLKLWMTFPDKRNALGVVRSGSQWRIPRPANLEQWRSETRWRLKQLGLELAQDWERNLTKIAQENRRVSLELYRFWLACCAAVLARGRITPKAGEAIRLLRQVAGEILGPLPDGTQVEGLKDQFSARLAGYGLSDQQVAAVMRYWPKKKLFEKLRTATEADLEQIGLRLDHTQAVQELKHQGKKATHNNIGPLLHKNVTAQVNDTRERLPGTVLPNPASEVIKGTTLASVSDQMAGKNPCAFTLDFRQPQEGLKRRTVQKRHPQKRYAERAVVAGVHRIAANVPGVEMKPDTRMTPIRKPDYESGTATAET